MKKITVVTSKGTSYFVGKHRKDLVTPTLYIYEKEDGDIISFLKEDIKYINEVEQGVEQYKEFRVVTIKVVVQFRGKYRADLEKPNWHYYEKTDGSIIHFRKEHIVFIEEVIE